MLDPATLAYVVLLHFEGDECGGMDRFMAEAKNAQLVGSDMSAVLNLTHFGVDYVDRVKGVRDGDVIDTGRHQLQVHRDAARAPLGLDDGVRGDDQEPVPVRPLHPARRPAAGRERGPHAPRCCGFYREIGIFAHEDPVRATIDRLERLEPEWVHAMHGGTLTGEILPRYTKALREEPFAFQGKTWGARSGSRPYRCHSGHCA